MIATQPRRTVFSDSMFPKPELIAPALDLAGMALHSGYAGSSDDFILAEVFSAAILNNHLDVFGVNRVDTDEPSEVTRQRFNIDASTWKHLNHRLKTVLPGYGSSLYYNYVAMVAMSLLAAPSGKVSAVLFAGVLHAEKDAGRSPMLSADALNQVVYKLSDLSDFQHPSPVERMNVITRLAGAFRRQEISALRKWIPDPSYYKYVLNMRNMGYTTAESIISNLDGIPSAYLEEMFGEK